MKYVHRSNKQSSNFSNLYLINKNFFLGTYAISNFQKTKTTIRNSQWNINNPFWPLLFHSRASRPSCPAHLNTSSWDPLLNKTVVWRRSAALITCSYLSGFRVPPALVCWCCACFHWNINNQLNKSKVVAGILRK